MAPNEEVMGSIPHAGVVLTIIVHPNMMGGPWTAGDSWHSSKIIRADEKYAGIIYITIFWAI
jgi:hypothetical protein